VIVGKGTHGGPGIGRSRKNNRTSTSTTQFTHASNPSFLPLF
jgi:hypothetical protein